MDRRETQPNQVAKAETASKPILLPSRQEALGQLQAAVERGVGPVLLTGEPGSGKTWLINQWISRATTPSLRWVSVDVPPGAGSVDLLIAIASALGLVVEPAPTASSLRIALSLLLGEQAVDERRWGLVVEEAHLATPEVLEELRILSNRMRQAQGFWAIVLVGQTALARHLSAWSMRGLEARLSGRVHLGPIDADEARLLLGPAVSVLDAERRHRDAEGNPGRLLRFDGPARRPLPRSAARRGRLVAEDVPSESEPKPRSMKAAPAPSILPSRPPLSVEDGVIEVGWDAEAETETDDESRASLEAESSDHDPSNHTIPRPNRTSVLGVEVPVTDHYAALQAWNEWTANQGRSEAPAAVEESDAEPMADSTDDDDDLYPPPPKPLADPDEEFTPYQQLFSRLSETAHDD